MNIVGFFFTKLHAHKDVSFKKGFTKDLAVDIVDLQEETLSFSSKGQAIKVPFKYQLKYNDPAAKKDNLVGEISLEGTITLMTSESEGKDILKSWKAKKLPPAVHEFIVNFILRKCTAKAIELEDSVNLPFHIPVPKASIK